MKVAVIGAGSWGTALAIKSVEAGNDTYLYHRDYEQAVIMAKTRKNPEYLTHVKIPDELVVSHDIEEVLTNATIVLMVTPSQYTRETLKFIKKFLNDKMYIVCCSKGLEKSTGKRMSDVLLEELQGVTEHIAILSGPNHAEEVAINLPSTTVIGTPNVEDGIFIRDALYSKNFRVYANTDMIGVELCGTTKNIVALAAGIVNGLELGDNCTSALITRGLHEMCRFGLAFGAQKHTYYGLSGMGDLIATCMSKNSRNRAAGIKLSQGLTMQEILEGTNMVVEGFFAVFTVYAEAQKHNIEMPITESLYAVLQGELTVSEAIENLMTRELKSEF